jgi:hypothetical protein
MKPRMKMLFTRKSFQQRYSFVVAIDFIIANVFTMWHISFVGDM